MPSAATKALTNYYPQESGSSNVELTRLLLKLADASAMNQSYTGKQPMKTFVEYLESFGVNQITKQIRRENAGIIAQEEKTS